MTKSVNNNTVFFLIAVLVAGIIAISFQSFIDTEASGDKRDHNKHKDYKHDNYKSKDPTVIVKKITCNNLDVNINGLRMDIAPEDIASELAAQAQDDNSNNEEISANSLGNGERNNFYTNNNDYDDGFIYICIDNINAQDSLALPTVPSDETQSDETPYPSTPPSTETPSDETQSDETQSDETQSDETPYPSTPPSTETPSDETQSDETQSDETPSGETPSGETQSDE